MTLPNVTNLPRNSIQLSVILLSTVLLNAYWYSSHGTYQNDIHQNNTDIATILVSVILLTVVLQKVYFKRSHNIQQNDTHQNNTDIATILVTVILMIVVLQNVFFEMSHNIQQNDTPQDGIRQNYTPGTKILHFAKSHSAECQLGQEPLHLAVRQQYERQPAEQQMKLDVRSIIFQP